MLEEEKLVTACCGNGKAKDILYIPYSFKNICFCKKCRVNSILISKTEYDDEIQIIEDTDLIERLSIGL